MPGMEVEADGVLPTTPLNTATNLLADRQYLER